MPGNAPRQDLIRESSVKIMGLNRGPSMRTRLPPAATESEAPAVCM